MKTLVVLLAAAVALCAAFPQREGASYTNEAIKQAQYQELIPRDAEIQSVKDSIEVGAFENLNGRIRLADLIKDVPFEVLANLQKQIDQIQ